MAIHCHSARYHYDSFHSRAGDVINIGSNNTYNIFGGGYNMGFGGYTMFGSQLFGRQSFFGSFGASLGWGLGNGLMNWLGNGLSGGGWNPAGIFAGSSFGWGNGMGNLGMGMSTPWSSFGWGGSTGRGADSSSSIAKKNADYAKLNKLFDRKNALLSKDNPSLDDLKTLKNDIDAVAKNLDGNDDGNDNDYIKSLRFGLDDKIKKLEGNQPSTTQSTNSTTTPVTQGSDGPDNTDGAGGASRANAAGTLTTPTTENDSWSSITNWGDGNPLAEKSIDLTDTGYTPIGVNDVISKVDLAHDVKRNGKNDDVKASECKLSESKHTETGKVSVPEYIALTDKKTYNYKFIGYTKNNLPVYTTPKQGNDNKGHIYVLVKKGNSYQLVQLNDDFTGLGKPDKQNG